MRWNASAGSACAMFDLRTEATESSSPPWRTTATPSPRSSSKYTRLRSTAFLAQGMLLQADLLRISAFPVWACALEGDPKEDSLLAPHPLAVFVPVGILTRETLVVVDERLHGLGK